MSQYTTPAIKSRSRTWVNQALQLSAPIQSAIACTTTVVYCAAVPVPAPCPVLIATPITGISTSNILNNTASATVSATAPPKNQGTKTYVQYISTPVTLQIASDQRQLSANDHTDPLNTTPLSDTNHYRSVGGTSDRQGIRKKPSRTWVNPNILKNPAISNVNHVIPPADNSRTDSVFNTSDIVTKPVCAIYNKPTHTIISRPTISSLSDVSGPEKTLLLANSTLLNLDVPLTVALSPTVLYIPKIMSSSLATCTSIPQEEAYVADKPSVFVSRTWINPLSTSM